ncbi:MAG: LpxL/LpxP family acyltransferase [Usitatibacter sp.]
MSSPSSPSAQWATRPERGNAASIRFMAWASLTLGRRSSRGLLRAVAAYFLATSRAARGSSRTFLERSLGRAPTLAEQYRLFFSFGAAVHDRIYFLAERFELFDIDVRGAELFDADGALLMGAHMGSFEVMRACGRHLGRRRVAMAMYEDNARKVNEVLTAIAPQAQLDIVALGNAGSMIELAARLDEGQLVGVLADRTLADEPTLRVPFLGHPAPFPTGPMRMAAALRRRVIFMTGLYRGGNRYDVRFEPLADFSDLEGITRAERDRRVQDAVVAYARRVEHYAREAPFNWFNFHDFWGPAP